MIRQLIFDMDGTLADTGKATIPALARVSAQYGLSRVPDQIILDTIGFANPEFYFRLYPALPKEFMVTFGSEVEAVEEKMIRALGKKILFPGIDDLLQSLKSLNITLHVASTGDSNHIHAVLEASGINAYFSSVCCGEPEKAGMIAKITGNHPRETFAMVGDRAYDLRAARQNFIWAIAAAYGYCSDADAANFDFVLRSPDELICLLQDIQRQPS